MRIPIPFVGPTFAGRSPRQNAQRTVNLYPKLERPGAKTIIGLYSTPGLKFDGPAGTGPIRSNGVKWKGDLYFVSGLELVKRNSSGVYSAVGTISIAGSRCELVGGRVYLMLVDGTNGYTWDGTTFAQIADADFPANPTHCSYLDGFFLVNKGGSDEFYKSASENPTAWNALDFATAESAPDDVLAHTVSAKNLYLIGEETTEVYYNSGNQDFPFDRYPNGVMDIGIEAPHSLTRDKDGMCWLASNADGDAFVVRVAGFQYQAISTPEIDWTISQMGIKTDAIGSIYRQAGRTWYVLTFPSADKTFVYDLSPDGQDWHERKSFGVGRWRVSGIGYAGGKVIVGDYDSPNFYELDFAAYTDNGKVIERKRRAPVIHKDNREITFWELTVDMETGVGLATGQGEDPQAMLRYSDDGGNTWSSELWADIGTMGSYKHRAIWRQLGPSRERIFELTITDPVPVTILGAYADVEASDA